MGMVRTPRRKCAVSPGSPHVRGDGPGDKRLDMGRKLFSHVRGDGPVSGEVRENVSDVLPTCVGDGPGEIYKSVDAMAFSPRAWGWSEGRGSPLVQAEEFSPRAWGWSGQRAGAERGCERSPHVRGDGPTFCTVSVVIG